MIGEAVDPQLEIDGQTASHSGSIAENETVTETIEDVSTGAQTGHISLTDGALDLGLDWTETTETVDPSVTIDSSSGSQTIEHTGTIADGSTVDLSDEVDESLIDGETTVSATVSDGIDGPVGKVRVRFEHNGVEWSAGAGVFEIEDSEGNSEALLPIDDIADLDFTDEQVRLNIQYVNGFGDEITARDYGVYLNGGE